MPFQEMQHSFDSLKITPKRMKVVSFGRLEAQNEALLRRTNLFKTPTCFRSNLIALCDRGGFLLFKTLPESR
jgi:hypothetical protein